MTDVVELIVHQHHVMDEILRRAEKAEPDAVVGVLQELADLLIPHSKAEEAFVYPAIAKHERNEADEVEDGAAEHHHVEALLQELLADDPAGAGYDGKLAAMIGELRHHVEEEEEELLPVLRKKASDAERAELGARFAQDTGDTSFRGSARASGTGSDSATKEQLYRKAQEQDIPGRSSMTKAELEDAVASD